MQPPLQPFRIRLNHRWQSDYCFYVLALTLQYGLHWCYFPKLPLVRQPQFPYCALHLTSKAYFKVQAPILLMKSFDHVFGCSETMIVVLNEQRDGIHPPI